MPIHAPYHAAHLYTGADVEQVLRLPTTPDVGKVLDRPVLTPVISSTSGVVFNKPSFGALLQSLVTNILMEQIRLDRVIEAVSELICTRSTASTLIPINTHIALSLAESLTHKGCKNVQCITESHSSSRPPENTSTTASSTGSAPRSLDSSKIAITGFSGRFPEADGLSEFWDLLQKGLDVHKPVPPDRFDGEAHYDPTGKQKNTSKIRHGCWIKNPGLFDARFFHMSPREACQADPAQRLALLTAYESLEMAGFVPDRTPSSQRHRVGVFYGTTSDDWREVNSGQNIDTYFIPGGNRAFIPGRINYFFKFSGPSVSVDTACSSSLAAINIACTSLLKHDCDTAIAGGTNVMTNPDNFAGLDRGHFLSPTGNCKTFDDDADGYCRADGVGTVVLKRLSDAVADNDPIFGIILGAHTNHSAEAVSITRPLADAQEFLFRKLLNESGVHPHEISYIEMHGTGTQAGDAVEMQSVLNTFAWDYSRRQEEENRSLHLGSVKANIGHAESASGVAALIKVLLMMQKNRIPPHCGIKGKINRGFPTDLAQRNVHIPFSETEWMPPKAGKRRVFVNNFSAAGGNTALLMEDAPPSMRRKYDLEDVGRDPRGSHVVTVSARSAKSLRENLASLAAFIGLSTSADLLSQISYTTTARRMHHSRRVAVIANDPQHLKRLLLDAAEEFDGVRPCPAKAPAVGFLLTGQGAQHTAMAYALFQHFSSFHSDILDFDAICRGQGFPSILPLVDGSIPIEELSTTVVQLGTCMIQIAMARLWINFGLEPQYVVGHSLGEYAALHIAGVLSISDTVYLAGYRATLLEKRCTPGTHGMVAVKASQVTLQGIILSADVPVEVACINSPDETVLSGPQSAIEMICDKLAGFGYKFTKLVLPFAFHSSQVEPILDELEQAARRVSYNQPKIPVVSPLRGTAITSHNVIGPEYIRRHCRQVVDFLGAVEAARRDRVIQAEDVCIEIGTHPILSSKMKSTIGQDFRSYPTLRRNEDAFKTLSETLRALHLAGVPLNWNEYHRDFSASHKVLNIPTYSWDYENYWIMYENNWCLSKGSAIGAPPVDVAASVKSTRLSSSVHRIVEERLDDHRAFIVAESDFHDVELLRVAQGHRVNGLVLCPSVSLKCFCL